jgi:hypothetical protein
VGTQWLFFGLCGAALLIGLDRDWKVCFTFVMFALCGAYGAAIAFRLCGVLWALWFSHEHQVSRTEITALADADLPVYTILVPMYREPEVADKIMAAVTALDYPQDKLDVKLLLEEDDDLTRKKVAAVMAGMPLCVEVIVCPAVPKGQPKTKPRACNWGLDRARGEYLVIYDAEDRPEPDQLKKAVATFRKLKAAGKKRVVCLQAKLNYFNADQNYLTRFFTLEYTNWFDLFLPGLHAFRTPIPLGGTSNHFHTQILRSVGGWDSFNVTEDCDLGIRLARLGYGTEILDSTTWEEANSRAGNWLRQRSRWIKGYLQTHLVHSRESWFAWLLLAGFFAYLFKQYAPELVSWERSGPPFSPLPPPSSTELFVLSGLRLFCAAAAVIGAGLAVFFLGKTSLRRFKENRAGGKKPAWGRLGFWHAFTFRLTVGGLSVLLLLNPFFWSIGGVYLFRHQLAELEWTRSVSVEKDDRGDRVSLRDSLKSWSLYHTRVSSDLHQGRTLTVWNTVGDYLRGRLAVSQVRERLQAIDEWSLVSQLFFPVAVGLFLANFIFILLGLVSCHKRNLWRLLPYALAMPLYWVLASIAAWKGLIQLLHNPWYWEKTTHGLTASSEGAGIARLPDSAPTVERFSSAPENDASFLPIAALPLASPNVKEQLDSEVETAVAWEASSFAAAAAAPVTDKPLPAGVALQDGFEVLEDDDDAARNVAGENDKDGV